MFRWFGWTGAVLIFATAVAVAQEGAAPAAEAEETTEEKGSAVLQEAIGKLIPEGKASVNVTVPGFSEGILKTLVKAASITRIDDDTLEMIEMFVEVFGTDGKTSFSIDMAEATFDMPSGILQSLQPAKISNAEFDIAGERLVYDTASEQGKLLGKVTMYVYSSEEESEEGSKKDE